MEDLSSDQLEEGEIIDDDSFEDISDNSIIDSFGKCVSSNENLVALSLSSDSDVFCVKKRRKTRTKTAKKRRKYKSPSSDSDISCSELKGKLKEAVHINDNETQKKPLETRLKGLMSNPQIEPPQTIDNDKNDDHELENLRIEALKTAVLNKFQRRKRKKLNLEEQKEELKPSETIENKENNTPIDKDVKTPALDLEEDEDVLRASLLAGLAKKITKIDNVVQQKKTEIPNLPPILPKLPTFNKKPIQKPQVKPLIININQDSDSEDEPPQKPEPFSKVSDLNVITSNVEKFLKEQRAKFETETKKRFQIVHKNKSILEKSAVKLLPKSQQIEYQQLLKKLKIAERKKRAKKIAQQKTTVEPPLANVELASSPAAVEIRVSPEMKEDKKADIVMKSAGETDVERNNEVNKDKKKSGITSELTTLQKTLKEIKMQRNGSLQIKSKYQVLTPIIRRITAASNERKKQEQRIKHLLEDLNEARNNLAQSHEQFSALVRELVDTKEKIDNSCKEAKTPEIKTKKITSSATIIVSDNHINVVNDKKNVLVTSTPIKKGDFPEDATINTSFSTNGYEDMDVCNSDETDMCQIDIVDPNDIDQIFTRKSIYKLSIPEYVSPLSLNTYDRYRHVDPHGIMCPYEVNGSCRDIDCTFKHYLKNSGKLK